MIAITGKSGSGKSFLLAQLAKKGFKVFNSDEYIKKLYQVNQAGYEIIKKRLGSYYINDKGVDKKRLKKWIMQNPQNLHFLEELIHPLIFKALVNNAFDAVEIAKVDSDVCNFRSLFKVVITLRTPEWQRKQFLNKRNVDSKSIELYDAINRGFGSQSTVNISYQDRQESNFLETFIKKFL